MDIGGLLLDPRTAITAAVHHEMHTRVHNATDAIGNVLRKAQGLLMGSAQSPPLPYVGYNAPPVPGTLVRFRGMVQDLSRGPLLDVIECPCGGPPQDHLSDVAAFYVLPVLGETPWRTDAFHRMGLPPTVSSMGGSPPTTATTGGTCRPADYDTSPAAKRTRNEGAGETVPTTEDEATVGRGVPHLTRSSQPRVPLVLSVPQNSAIPRIRLNDVVDGVGIVEASDDLWDCARHVGTRGDSDDLLELDHVIHIRVLGIVTEGGTPTNTKGVMNINISTVRCALHQFLTHALGGDDIAASYLLLHLLGKVHTRPNGIPVGDLVLNLFGVGPREAAHVVRLVEVLKPRVAVVDAASERRALVPAFDLKTGNLRPSLLQLPEGTSLVLVEGTAPPRDDTSDIFDALLLSQTLDYDTGYGRTSSDVDHAVLVLSQRPSPLTLDCRLRTSFTVPPIWAPPPPDVCATFREYISHCRGLPLHGADDALGDVVSRMTEVRASGLVPFTGTSEVVRVNTFSTWMTLTRLTAQSHGDHEWSVSRLDEVFAIEVARGQRFAS